MCDKKRKVFDLDNITGRVTDTVERQAAAYDVQLRLDAGTQVLTDRALRHVLSGEGPALSSTRPVLARQSSRDTSSGVKKAPPRGRICGWVLL